MYKDKSELIELTQKYTSQVNNFSNQEILDGIDINNCNNIYDELIKLIKFHNYLYYIEAFPIISDLQYDKLFTLIIELENNFPDIIKQDSPTQQIEIEIQKEFKSVKHKLPLLSLGNSYNAENLKDWETFLKRQIKNEENIELEYFIEPKFDGVGGKMDRSHIKSAYCLKNATQAFEDLIRNAINSILFFRFNFV